MRAEWLQRHPGADAVIVIFGGWAIGPTVWAHLRTGADVLHVSDYRSLADDLPDLSAYPTRSLIAWSFGVASYALWQVARPDPFQRRVALCGSTVPVDRQKGIPPQMVRMTSDNLSHAGFQQFLTRCHGAEQPAQDIDVAARRAELDAIAARDYGGLSQTWDRIWIATDDRIFPPANLRRAWAATAGVVREIAAPHLPFARWSRFDEVLA